MKSSSKPTLAFTGYLWAIVSCVSADPSSVPKEQHWAEILKEQVIVRQVERYIGWPSIVRAGNGDLVAVFSGDRDWHVCPWGKTHLVRSSDNGTTWSEPVVITNTPLDDRDAGLVVLPDGNLLLTFFTSVAFDSRQVVRYAPYRRHAEKISTSVRAEWLGNWSRLSRDHGKTWERYQRMPASTPHGPSSLANGSLLMVRQAVHQSFDQGKTWEQIAAIKRNPETWKSRYAFLSEQHAVEAADGRIIALSRYADGADIDLRQIESDDGGRTWTEPRPTGMRGYPAHLLRLENDWLLAVYGRRIAPMGQRACISKDNGRTWLVDEEIVLSNAVPQGAGHLGYPSSTQLPDGSIWTVYYQVADPADGEYPSLMGTHWRIK